MRYPVAMLARCDDEPFRRAGGRTAKVHSAQAAANPESSRLRLRPAHLRATVKLYLDRIAAYDRQGPVAATRSSPSIRAALETAAEMDRSYRADPASAGAAALHPDHPQGQLQHLRHADQRRQCQHEDLDAARRRVHRGKNAQGRCADPRQGEHAGVRARRHVDLEPRRPGAQSLRPRPHARRIERRHRRLDRGELRGARHRQRYRPVDPSPASANNLVGIRPTRGLVSRAGVIPNSLTQDEIGPIARTVTDAALYLRHGATTRPIPSPPSASGDARRATRSRCARMRSKGARIGVMTNLFGTAERHAEVNRVMEGVIERMAGLGATIVRFDLPDYDTLAPIVIDVAIRGADGDGPLFRGARSECADQELRRAGRRQNLGGAADARSRDRGRRWHEQPSLQGAQLNRDKLRLAVAKTMADLDLQAILYPLQKILVAPVTAEEQFERNGTLSNGTGFPAVTFPAASPRPRHPRRSACPSAPSCSAPIIPRRVSSLMPTLSSRRAAFASCRKARRRSPASRRRGFCELRHRRLNSFFFLIAVSIFRFESLGVSMLQFTNRLAISGSRERFFSFLSQRASHTYSFLRFPPSLSLPGLTGQSSNP